MSWTCVGSKTRSNRHILTNKPGGKRPQGKPIQRWMDRVKNDLIRIDESVRVKDSENKNRRKDLVEVAKGLQGVYCVKKKKIIIKK